MPQLFETVRHLELEGTHETSLLATGQFSLPNLLPQVNYLHFMLFTTVITIPGYHFENV
ncbi:hypothetical protein FORC9_3570 [Vibrio vulnificus]|nr:hypothetical protein FORC9_3570 [Vibrio vulnificus]ANH65447.1 hypothetical protein FORC16_3564 [Vibrio vulnificus]